MKEENREKIMESVGMDNDFCEKIKMDAKLTAIAWDLMKTHTNKGLMRLDSSPAFTEEEIRYAEMMCVESMKRYETIDSFINQIKENKSNDGNIY